MPEEVFTNVRSDNNRQGILKGGNDNDTWDAGIVMKIITTKT
jgi:hypothetical protein